MTGPRRSPRQAKLQPKNYKESDDEDTDSEEEESEDLFTRSPIGQRYGQSSSPDNNNRSKNSPSSSFLNFSQTSSPGSSSSPSFNTSPGGKKMYPNLLNEIDGSPSLHKSTPSLGTGTSEPSKTSDNDGTSYRKYIQDIENMSQEFPKQKKRLWTTVKASAHHILNETHSDYPSVIMMATDIHTNNLALCLAKLITSKFQSAGGNPQHPSVVDVDTLKYMQNMEQKKTLDDRLYEVLSKHKSVIIDNLQMLSAEAALLLHSYCDNDNAPYKDVMIVLMFYIDSSVHLLDPDRPNSVERYVENLWIKDLDIDKVSAILSRVANNIVVVSDEETLPKTLCSDV
ncbi:torsin-1A-interacting protein 2 [Biomphalaria pfeifferi]|uniref:Torsin-1A-interacting protein 2 n=1 Tax=Biomphalaria pfeifferi TaxID=112525 RepID=A0AAD8FFY9_BIOPF|nr:torsin-1A-interacting protein 2 [Biomphalaria pfeifferi]